MRYTNCIELRVCVCTFTIDSRRFAFLSFEQWLSEKFYGSRNPQHQRGRRHPQRWEDPRKLRQALCREHPLQLLRREQSDEDKDDNAILLNSRSFSLA